MTYEDAIYCITVMRNEVLDTWEFDFSTEQTDALRLAIEAMKLQVAKKPLEIYERTEKGSSFYYLAFMCPSCESSITGQPYKPNNCKHCGQKLDFGE